MYCLVVFFSCLAAAIAGDPLCDGVPPNEVVLFPYPNDCTKYYECANGTKTAKDCPAGLWFNVALQGCDHPDHSGCIQPTTEVSPTTNHPWCSGDAVDYFPYPDNCTLYYECYKGALEVHKCVDGLWFNAREKRCVFPEQSECGNYSTSTSSPTPTSSTTSPTTRSSSTTSSTPSTSSGTTSTHYPYPSCDWVSENVTVLLPYPGDCNKFIECYGRRATVMNCPSHLYFNEDKQLCDWPSESGCDDTTVTPDPYTTSTAFPPTTQDGDDDPRCANGNTDYWPHPADCTLYIECYRGHGYTMKCPSGLFFNAATKECVNPKDSDCKQTTPGPVPSSTTDHSDYECDDAPDADYLFPYPGDCTKYYMCSDGMKVEKSCPPGLWFNPTLEVCDDPEHSGCTQEYIFKKLWKIINY